MGEEVIVVREQLEHFHKVPTQMVFMSKDVHAWMVVCTLVTFHLLHSVG